LGVQSRLYCLKDLSFLLLRHFSIKKRFKLSKQELYED